MTVEIAEEGQSSLIEYARIPIAFEVREVFDVTESRAGSADFLLTPREVVDPYVKDYESTTAARLAYPTLPGEVQLLWYKELRD